MPKNAFYKCDKCDFISVNKADFKRHQMTRKHILKSKDLENKVVEKTRDYVCIYCNKSYRYSQGLSKHRAVCLRYKELQEKNYIVEDYEKIELINLLKQELEYKNKMLEMKDDMIKECKQQNEDIKSIIPKIGNSYNFSIYLNEQCKNAMNMDEFIKSLKITFEDFNYSIENGKKDGISNILMKELKGLREKERPVHCTDMDKNTLYVKDNDKWSEDDNYKIMNKSIGKVEKRQSVLIGEWEEKHPGWMEDEGLKEEYVAMVQNTMSEMTASEKREIIKKMSEIIKLDAE